MNSPSPALAKSPSIDDGVRDLMRKARQTIRQQHQNCENSIRQSPTKAVLIAVGVGCFLHLLPMRAILMTKVRVLSALAPPALYLFGVAKLIEFLRRPRTNGQN